jgi:hypothetical protein
MNDDMLRPMTPAEAEAAYDEAPAIPMSEQEIDSIVEKVTRARACVYRAQYQEDSGWWVTYGPRRPVAARQWLEGPMTQQQAKARIVELQKAKGQ